MPLSSDLFSTVRREGPLALFYRLNDAVNATLAADYAAKYGLTGFYAGSPAGGPPLIQEDTAAGSASFSAPVTNVQSPDIPALRLTTALALECWVLPTVAGQTAVLVSKGNATIKSAPYALSLVAGVVNFSLGDGNTQTSIADVAALPVGIPSHLVGTLFRGVMSLYVNGGLVSSGAVGNQAVADAGQALWVGGGQQSNSFFTGLMAEVAVYSGALGAKRVLRHFNIGRQINEDSAHYYGIDPPVYS